MSSSTKKKQNPGWKFEATFSISSNAETPSIQISSKFSADAGSSTTTNEIVNDQTDPVAQPAAASNINHNVGFSFVNVAHPDDARGSVNKRTIRSHVAKVQHSKVRSSVSTLKKATKESKTRALSLPSLPPIRIQPKSAETAEASYHPHVPNPPMPRTGSITLTAEDDEEVDDFVPRSRQDSHWSNPSHVNSNAVKRLAAHPATLTLVRMLRGGRHDPFWTYPVPFHPHMERIVDHYLVHIAVDVPFIVPTNEPGLLRRKWFPLALAEPATFYAIALMAATHHAVVNPAFGNAINLFILRGKAISAINEALTDPQRRISDATMGAVMKMASYEAIFGEERFFHAHMDGLKLMVEARGGLPNLGMDGLLERIVLWVDSNASHHLGCAWKFDKKRFPTTVLHPAIDPPNFAGGEAPPTCPTMALASAPPQAMPAALASSVA